MPAKPLQRVTMMGREDFFRRHASPREPVIITNLFEGDPIREVRSLQDAKRAFGTARLLVTPEYTSTGAAASHSPQVMSFEDYWHYVERDPATNYMCTEYEIPSRVMALLSLPDLCRIPVGGPGEVLSLPKRYGDHDLLLNAFVGNRGNKAHLHYDGDQRHVLLYQVFGVKDVIVFRPESGPKLKPLHSLVFSGIALEQMSREARQELLDAADGYYGTLEPGEAVFIPMLAWHYLEYVENAMSVNIRFGRNPYGRFLCVDNFHRDYYIQNVASQFAETELCAQRYRRAIEELVAEYVRPVDGKLTKVRAVRALFKRLLSELCSPLEPDDFCPVEYEEQELAKIMLSIRDSACYTPPDALASSRPLGPASPQQMRHLRERGTQLGYTTTVFEKILSNRVGKPKMETLTKAEAAQILNYMRSPGAQW